jgi:hypothetical protein
MRLGWLKIAKEFTNDHSGLALRGLISGRCGMSKSIQHVMRRAEENVMPQPKQPKIA